MARDLEVYGYIDPTEGGLIERFYSKIDLEWQYTGAKNQGGYGIFSYGNPSKFIAAHKLSWILSQPFSKPLQEGEVIHHRCDHGRACCNPECLMRMESNSAHMTNNPDHRESRGEGHYRALLTEAQVIEIRALHEAGMSQSELARRYVIAPPTVWMIVHRKTWKHVEDA
jgi:hypothetical protein